MNDPQVTIRIERDRHWREERYTITVGDSKDYVYLEPQATLDDAEGVAEDMFALLLRLGVTSRIAVRDEVSDD